MSDGQRRRHKNTVLRTIRQAEVDTRVPPAERLERQPHEARNPWNVRRTQPQQER